MSEVSEDDTSPLPTNNNNNTYLTRFHVMQTLCSRSEKYLPMEDSEPLMLKAESRTSLSFNSGSSVLALNPNSKPFECKPLPGKTTRSNNNAVMSTPERRALSKTMSKTPPRLLLTPTHSPGASPNVRYVSTQSTSPPGASPRSFPSPHLTSPSGAAAYSPNGRTFAHYGNVTMSPSKGASLTSPFPMQFRARTSKNNKAPKEATDGVNSVPKFSMQDQVDAAIKSKETIDDVVMTTTVPSSPTPATAAKKKLAVATATTSNNRPPPCPGRTTVIPSPHDARRKRLLGRWRNRTQLRSSSMMDKDDDDEDISDDETNEEEEIELVE
jgi:hypothetical protein